MMPKLNKLDEYLTVGQAAAHIGVSKDTLRRWDNEGKLTARRHPVTGYRLYLVKELDALLNSAVKAARPASRRRGKRSKL